MDFNSKLTAFVESVKEKSKDGITFEEAFAILYEFVAFAVEAAKELQNPGPEKRAIVLSWVGKLFDVLAPLVVMALPKWYWPLVPVVRPINRQIVLAAAGALIEWILKD